MFKKYKHNNTILGRRYENYVAGYLKHYGWDVTKRGQYGVYDRGIDLIATRNGVTRYIQCKNWKYTRNINENVINQFYGSVVSQEGADNVKNVELFIYSPAKPTDYAKDKAEKLGIQFRRVSYLWRWKHKNTKRVKSSSL